VAATDRQIFDLIVSSVGYKTTVGDVDKSKVNRTFNGQTTVAPASKLGQAAWHLAKRISATPPPPPPPPPPPAPKLAAQTYNKGSRGQNARYCTTESGNPDGGGFHYSPDGLCEGGRSEKFVPGLKPADEMDGRGACDPYGSFPPWPKESYEV
jgi:hypothetical protein